MSHHGAGSDHVEVRYHLNNRKKSYQNLVVISADVHRFIAPEKAFSNDRACYYTLRLHIRFLIALRLS